MLEKLRVTGVQRVDEPEPGIVEIAVQLEGKSTAVLRMSILTFIDLWSEIRPLASAAERLQNGHVSPS